MKDSFPETVKDNASVVGSSLTESRQDLESYSGVGSSNYQDNEDFYPSAASERGQAFKWDRNMNAVRNKNSEVTRYFIIKSLSYDNIQLSVDKGIWATQVMNEPILEEAFHNSSKVILIFSVNMSGFFQGYAQMISSVGRRRENVWTGSSGGSNPWGRSFKIKWIQLHNLPFQKTLHLKNPLNDYKPVKISRDCQELPQDIGNALCQLIDEDEKLKRANEFGDNFLLNRPFQEYQPSVHDEDNVSLYPFHNQWTQGRLLHPSAFFQQPVLTDAQNTQLMDGRSQRVFFLENLPSNLEEQIRLSASPMSSQITRDSVLRFGERSHPDSLSEEDFLDMVVAGPARGTQGDSKSSNQV
ncbi:uncharacterized protein [Aristolochia californica]|uniref:uncharacterized protein isoform X2 n=1 Tax=Aristolochia californica TaxID=171875 RepID=UPI0035DC2887